MFKLNKFLDQDYLIKQAIADNDYETLRDMYFAANQVSYEDLASISESNKIFEIPDDCTSEDCPYICEQFITPSGVNAHELFEASSRKSVDKAESKTQHLRNVKSLSKSLVENLGIDFVDDLDAIMPVKNASTSMDRTHEAAKEMKFDLSAEEIELLHTKIAKDIYRTYKENDLDELYSDNTPVTDLAEIKQFARESREQAAEQSEQTLMQKAAASLYDMLW